jgi:hypothetical protein
LACFQLPLSSGVAAVEFAAVSPLTQEQAVAWLLLLLLLLLLVSVLVAQALLLAQQKKR